MAKYGPKPMPVEVRLLAKIEHDLNGCWIFSGSRNNKGYGMIGIINPRRMVLVHRVAYELWVDFIPDGLFVLHSCDVPNCVNPKHLFVGTQKDNMADCSAKGRISHGKQHGRKNRGEKHGMTHLTEDDVRRIRELRTEGGSLKTIAKKFKVSLSTVSHISIRRIWKHVV